MQQNVTSLRILDSLERNNIDHEVYFKAPPVQTPAYIWSKVEFVIYYKKLSYN